jgi:dihydroflavonol-4-reductase
MSRILVTGATGLVGSEIAEQLVSQGHDVVALVREETPSEPLERLGVKIVRGDLSEGDAVDAALTRCDAVIHSAAAVGRPGDTLGWMRSINVDATVALLDKARAAGVGRVVALSTGAVFDAVRAPLTERSPLNPTPLTDPYTTTKTESYLAVMGRAEQGQDIVVVIPASTYGPCPMGRRVLDISGANQRVVKALRGEPALYFPMSMPYSFNGDVARCTIAALERGVTGHRYLAYGAPDSYVSFAGFVNRACELAGVDNRVDEFPADQIDEPETLEKFGPTLVAFARARFADPFFDNRITRQEIGYQPLSVDEGLQRTVDWMRDSQLI